jgi:hypothetical protein
MAVIQLTNFKLAVSYGGRSCLRGGEHGRSYSPRPPRQT